MENGVEIFENRRKTMSCIINMYLDPIVVYLWLAVLTILWIVALAFHVRSATSTATKRPIHIATGKCSATSCGAIDPINDPDYNMREVIKNTLLIEQHLSEPNKYCKQCIVKHFLISIGLLEEAMWMAGSSHGKYPMLDESLPFHENIFDAWYAHVEDVDERAVVLDKMRTWRRQASELYFPT